MRRIIHFIKNFFKPKGHKILTKDKNNLITSVRRSDGVIMKQFDRVTGVVKDESIEIQYFIVEDKSLKYHQYCACVFEDGTSSNILLVELA